MIGLAFLAVLIPSPATVYIGTYTSAGGSHGIYRVELNVQTGALSKPVLSAETTNPSYLACSPNGRNLFSVDESKDGSVSAFSIAATQELKFLNKQPVPGAAPCFLSVDPKGRDLLVASYSVGYISSLPIAQNGWLKPVACQILNHGTGPNTGRQEQSHMHWISADPSDRFVYSCDLGSDLVRCDRFNPATGQFTPASPVDASSPSGAGPRHGAFGRSGNYVYVDNEMDESVSVFKADHTNGALRRLQTISNLKEGKPQPGSTSAEIQCHPNGRWLYVSNRGADTITVFDILSSGLLRRLQIFQLPVHTPRGFAVDPSGRWLVVAGQNSNDLVALSIDSKSGKVSSGGNKISVGSPVCVVFKP